MLFLELAFEFENENSILLFIMGDPKPFIFSYLHVSVRSKAFQIDEKFRK